MNIRPYNKLEIIEKLNQFKVAKTDSNVVASYNNKIVSSESISEKYYIFDFGEFAKELIENITNYFTPLSYDMLIARGFQEIRIYGEEVLINGDKYDKMLSILNSTDKSRTLQMNIGLIRKTNQSGIVIDVDNSSVRGKHFCKSLPERLKLFGLQLQNFNDVIESQTIELVKICDIELTFKEFAYRFLRYDKKGNIRSGDINKLKAFTKNLKLTSTSDKISDLTFDQKCLLNNPSKYEDYVTDVYLNAYQVFNIYTELFKNYDASVLRRETKRVMDVIFDRYDKENDED